MFPLPIGACSCHPPASTPSASEVPEVPILTTSNSHNHPPKSIHQETCLPLAYVSCPCVLTGWHGHPHPAQAQEQCFTSQCYAYGNIGPCAEPTAATDADHTMQKIAAILRGVQVLFSFDYCVAVKLQSLHSKFVT